MAFALDKTKRKLNQILDSISNISDTSLPLKRPKTDASSTTLSEPPAKKRRPLRPFSSYVPSTLQEIFEEDEEKRRTSFVEEREKAKKPKPNFTPWDRGDFLERLKTFRHPYLWMTKPDKVNEVQWSKRGWRCVGKDRVACAGCGKELVVSLEPNEPAVREDEGDVASDDGDWRQRAQEQLVEKYSEMIVTGHDEGCLWRRRGCDATIQRLPLVHPSTTLEGLRLRYESFVNLKAELPTSLRTPEKIDIKALAQSLSSTLHPAQSAEPSEDPSITIVTEINERALQFALFGWQAESERGLELATCNACFRRLGLWLFVPRPDPGSPSGEKEAVVNRLDLVQEHRSYCPWSNPTTQSGGVKSSVIDDEAKELAGWEMVLRVAENLQYTQNLEIDSLLTLERPLGASTNLDRAAKDAKDQERFAKFKKLKKAFTIKRVKRVGKENVVRPSTAG